jgi:hypothetical protein
LGYYLTLGLSPDKQSATLRVETVAGDRELKAMEVALGALTPLDPEERRRVVDWLAAKLELAAPTPLAPAPNAPVGGGGGSTGNSNIKDAKQFLKDKAPADDIGRVAALAYQLTHGKGLAQFKNAEFRQARIDASIPKLNLSRAIYNAQRRGYLTTASYGTYKITADGEALVEAMPNADAVKAVKAGRQRRRRSTTTKKRTPKKATAKKT